MNANKLVSEIIESARNINNVHPSVKGTSVQHYSNLDVVSNVCQGTKLLKKYTGNTIWLVKIQLEV